MTFFQRKKDLVLKLIANQRFFVQKKPINCKPVDSVSIDVKEQHVPGCQSVALKAMLRVAKDLKELLRRQFSEFENEIFQSMKWIDPKIWDDDREFGEKEIVSLSGHFQKPLVAQGFELSKAKQEWKNLKILVRRLHPGSDAKSVWKSILQNRREDYPNMLVLVISGSNSAVERTFSTLTLMLSDRRLCLKHENIENVILLKGNDKIWSIKERNEIIDGAVKKYLKKSRKRKLELSSDRSNHTEMESESDNDNESDTDRFSDDISSESD